MFFCSKPAKANNAPVATTSATDRNATEAEKEKAQETKDEQDAEEDEGGGYVINPQFPEMPASVPLTYTLTMHACLSASPEERPTFQQVPTLSTSLSFSQCI